MVFYSVSVICRCQKKALPKPAGKRPTKSLSRFLSEKALRGGKILLSDKPPLPQEGGQFRKEGTERPDPQGGAMPQDVLYQGRRQGRFCELHKFSCWFLLYLLYSFPSSPSFWGPSFPRRPVPGQTFSAYSIVRRGGKISSPRKFFRAPGLSLQSHMVTGYNSKA